MSAYVELNQVVLDPHVPLFQVLEAEDVADFSLFFPVLFVVEGQGLEGDGGGVVVVVLGGCLVAVELEEVFGLLLGDLGRQDFLDEVKELVFFDWVRGRVLSSSELCFLALPLHSRNTSLRLRKSASSIFWNSLLAVLRFSSS